MSAAQPRGFLIIDDSDDFTVLATRYLRKEWPTASFAAWNPVKRGRPGADFDWSAYDIVLLDYQLGEDDGLRWLRLYGRNKGFPLTIMMTAEGSEEVAVKAFKLGASDYIPKRQINAAVLISAVREVWAGRELPPEPVAAARADGPFTVAGYRLLEKLGQGATATVYAAERQSDGLRLVIKALKTEGSGIDTYVERFLQEYDIVDRVRHPNVVRIYDRGMTSDSLYIAMEFFAGGDLQQRLRREHVLSPAAALDATMQIAEGLDAVHRVGVVHRDLKPSNVMIRADGSLALIDFGIAKQLETRLAYTQAGMVLGTPGYSSPENLTGKGLDGRSDLYSLGAMLFEMLSGYRSFAGMNTPALICQQLNDPVPRLPIVLAQYQDLIDRTLARDPAERYASARELIKVAGILRAGAPEAPVMTPADPNRDPA